VLRETPSGWFVEGPLSLAEARLVGRTFASPAARVWMRSQRGWSLLDQD
jgi:hypothetical protein